MDPQVVHFCGGGKMAVEAARVFRDDPYAQLMALFDLRYVCSISPDGEDLFFMVGPDGAPLLGKAAVDAWISKGIEPGLDESLSIVEIRNIFIPDGLTCPAELADALPYFGVPLATDKSGDEKSKLPKLPKLPKLRLLAVDETAARGAGAERAERDSVAGWQFPFVGFKVFETYPWEYIIPGIIKSLVLDPQHEDYIAFGRGRIDGTDKPQHVLIKKPEGWRPRRTVPLGGLANGPTSTAPLPPKTNIGFGGNRSLRICTAGDDPRKFRLVHYFPGFKVHMTRDPKFFFVTGPGIPALNTTKWPPDEQFADVAIEGIFIPDGGVSSSRHAFDALLFLKIPAEKVRIENGTHVIKVSEGEARAVAAGGTRRSYGEKHGWLFPFEVIVENYYTTESSLPPLLIRNVLAEHGCQYVHDATFVGNRSFWVLNCQPDSIGLHETLRESTFPEDLREFAPVMR